MYVKGVMSHFLTEVQVDRKLIFNRFFRTQKVGRNKKKKMKDGMKEERKEGRKEGRKEEGTKE